MAEKSATMDEKSVVTAYRRWAHSYDRLFGPIFEPGRKLVVDHMHCKPGDHILEVGVGTGLALPHYPPQSQVVGIDLSPHMLGRAQKRVADKALRNVHLQIMDAQNLAFPDGCFDKVTAMYVASVVPDPQAMVAEMKRVCRPHGDLFIVNHFSHTNGIVHAFERLASPLSKLIGFRPVFPRDKFIEDSRLRVTEVIPVNLLNYWTMVHAVND